MKKGILLKPGKSKGEYCVDIQEHLNIGGRIISCTYNPEILKALKRFRKHIEVYPIVPDTSQYIRDMNKYGLVGMGIRRVLRLGPVNLFKTGVFALKKINKARKKHFPTILQVLVFMELLEFKKFNTPIVFLHSQMTDLADANSNMRLFKAYEGLVKKNRIHAGLMTNNLGSIASKTNFRYYATFFNKKGFGMRPSQKKCEEVAKHKDIIAFNASANSTLEIPEMEIYLKQHNIKAYIK